MNAIAQPSAPPASGPQLDNRRVLAALIDLAIVAAGAALILGAAGVLGGERADLGLPLAGVVTAWALYYYFACESGGGQTLGKRLLKIRVVRVDGGPTGISDIAVRTVLRVIDMQFAYLVGLIVMLATGKRRGRLGDLAAGTMIVAADGPAPPVAAASGTPAPGAVLSSPDPAGQQAPASVELEAPERVVEPRPVVEPMPVDQPEADEEPEVTVRSVETVSAIDLVMGDEGPDRDEPDPDDFKPPA